MENITLYRRRLIPDEIVHLKDDVVLYHDDTVIITKWKTIKPRKDMDHGFSAYLLKEGIKVSKFYRADNSLLYWYCDIVDYEYDATTNSYTSTDLLTDVVLYPDGQIRVLDLDELAEASVKDMITKDQLHSALVRTDKLLNTMYQKTFDQYTKLIDRYDI
ncbi:MAG: DUF402 domain-containing protein [Lachnospiraceae bacterium]|nr:DUF402 domain-containing protein [Lachnospiraceae bacterium]MBQ3035653.1 DUF402 domain-containing protein [Lachnospiraceae bacterium]